MRTPSCPPPCGALLALAFLPLALFAQPAKPVADAPPAAADEILSLGEFSVSGAETGQYVASETMTGSRVKEKIERLPYVVNVVTSEFLREFAFFDMHDEEFTFATSAYVPADSANGGVQIRGQGATKSLRNGFSRVGTIVDAVNIDRVEIIRGPSATVYGENRPGGIVNIISKRPKTKPGYRLSAAAGSFDFARTEVEATGPLTADKKTAYLFTASAQERGYEMDAAAYRRKTVSGVITHAFSPQTNLTIELEHLKQHNNWRPQISFVNDASQPATQRVTRLATAAEEPRSFNNNGPQSYTNREVNSGMAALEHRLSPVLSVRAAASFYNIGRTDWTNTNVLTYELTGVNAGTAGNRAPGWGCIDEQAYMAQVDLLAQYPLGTRRFEGKSLLTLDFASNYHVDPQFAVPAAGANSVADLVARGLYAQRVRPLGVNNLSRPPIEPIATRITRWRKNRADDLGLLARQQFSGWDGRLIASVGGRFDLVQFRLQDKLQEKLTGNPARNIAENTRDTAFTPNAGVNYAVLPGVRAYLNYAKSYYVDTQNRTAGSLVQTNEGGYGWDYGLKFGLLEQRLNFTLGGWYIERTNVTVNEFDPDTLTTVQRTVGATLSRGFDCDANWRVTDALSATFGGSHLSAIFTDNGNDLDSLGRQQPRLPKDSAYLTLRYAGPVKGLSTNVGVSYTGESQPYTTTGGIVEGATSPRRGLIVSHNGSRDITIPAYYSARLGAAYTWRPAGPRVIDTLSLNVTNPLNERHVLNSVHWNEPFNLIVTNTVKF